MAASVNRRMDTDQRILFPTGVALTDTPLGHLEFAIRHEGLDLATIAAALPQIGRDAMVVRLRENPNGEYIRRIACHVGMADRRTTRCGRQTDGALRWLRHSPCNQPLRADAAGTGDPRFRSHHEAHPPLPSGAHRLFRTAHPTLGLPAV